MINLIEIAVSVLILMSGIKINDFYKPEMLEIHLSNGNMFNIKINKNNSYACPVNCGAIHYHDVLMADENKTEFNYNISYAVDGNSKLKLNGNNIIKIFEVNTVKNNKNKNNKNDSTKRRVDIQNFIKKYNL
tara:strand:+ start:1913 stop:2308 length:396 start_codon:yes stop_codon:yes gene_type:complete